jgi:hypothetical protein
VVFQKVQRRRRGGVGSGCCCAHCTHLWALAVSGGWGEAGVVRESEACGASVMCAGIDVLLNHSEMVSPLQGSWYLLSLCFRTKSLYRRPRGMKTSMYVVRSHTSCRIPCAALLPFTSCYCRSTLCYCQSASFAKGRPCISSVYVAAIYSQCGSAEGLHAQQQDQQQNPQKVMHGQPAPAAVLKTSYVNATNATLGYVTADAWPRVLPCRPCGPLMNQRTAVAPSLCRNSPGTSRPSAS